MASTPILFTEEQWANCHLSIAKYYGGARILGKDYRIVNKDGIYLFQLSDPDSEHYIKEGKAIQPGEPADLVQLAWIPLYRKIGRDKFLAMIKGNPNITLQQAKQLYKK